MEKIITIKKIEDVDRDLTFWLKKNYQERLNALEELREEYNNWRYTDVEQRFQRVYKVIKQK